ncbi:MAG: hypothetical protein IJT25_01125 [Clostridia bacterium]|nr:hypothetical protein [Clostridia bacterium]
METSNLIKKMKIQELISLINTLPISKDEFYVVSSGALVLRGILPEASDLDIAVSSKGLEQLKKYFYLKKKNDDGWFTVNKNVECVCNGPKENWANKPELCNDVYVQDIEEYYEYLKTSEREKDKKRIPLVEQYIKNHNMNKG